MKNFTFREKMPRAVVKFGCLTLASVGLAKTSVGAILLTTTADAAVSGPDSNSADANGTSVSNTTLTTARAGSNSSSPAGSIGKSYQIPFQLPALAAGQTFTAASLTVVYASANGQGGTVGTYPDGVVANFNCDLYGLGARASSTVLTSDYYQGPSDPTNATLLQHAILAPGTAPADATPVTTGTAGQAALTAYLNAQYAAAGPGSWVFLRLNADADSGVTGNYAYNFYTFDQNSVTFNAAPQSAVPAITYSLSSVPEPTSVAAIGFAAAGFLARRRRVGR